MCNVLMTVLHYTCLCSLCMHAMYPAWTEWACTKNGSMWIGMYFFFIFRNGKTKTRIQRKLPYSTWTYVCCVCVKRKLRGIIGNYVVGHHLKYISKRRMALYIICLSGLCAYEVACRMCEFAPHARIPQPGWFSHLDSKIECSETRRTDRYITWILNSF